MSAATEERHLVVGEPRSCYRTSPRWPRRRHGQGMRRHGRARASVARARADMARARAGTATARACVAQARAGTATQSVERRDAV